VRTRRVWEPSAAWSVSEFFDSGAIPRHRAAAGLVLVAATTEETLVVECPLCMGDTVHLRARVAYEVKIDGIPPETVEATVKLYEAERDHSEVSILAYFCALHRLTLVPDEWDR